MELDINFVRNQFPAFSENSLKNKAFFENNLTSLCWNKRKKKRKLGVGYK